MKNTHIFIGLFLLILSQHPVFSQNYNEYEPELYMQVEAGEGQNQLAVSITQSPRPNAPRAIGFTTEGELLICDTLNERTVIIDNENNWRMIPDNNTYRSNSTYVNEVDNDIFIYESYLDVGVTEIPRNEELLSLNWRDFNSNVKPYSSIYFPNIVFTWTEDRNIVSITNPSTDRNENRQNYHNSEETRALFSEDSDFQMPEGLTIDDEDRLFLNGQLQAKNLVLFASYWISLNRSHWQQEGHAFMPYLHSRVFYAGEDSDGNIYFHDDTVSRTMVFSEEGIVLNFFDIDSSYTSTLPAIHPSGDVYFLSYDEDNVYIWRVERRW